jgi:hypothetical protein
MRTTRSPSLTQRNINIDKLTFCKQGTLWSVHRSAAVGAPPCGSCRQTSCRIRRMNMAAPRCEQNVCDWSATSSRKTTSHTLCKCVAAVQSESVHQTQDIIKVILLADSICSRLLSWFGSPMIKKIPEYHPPNVYGYVEIWMYIMS